MFDTIIVGLLHVSLISGGFSSFILIASKIEDNVLEPPIKQLFVVFAIYGSLMLMILHSLTWQYSGMAFFGFLAVVLISTHCKFYVSYSLRKIKRQSQTHFLLFVLGLLYTPIAGILLASMFRLILILEDFK